MNLKRSAINGLSKKHFFLSKTIVSTIRGEKKKYFGFGFLTTSGFWPDKTRAASFNNEGCESWGVNLMRSESWTRKGYVFRSLVVVVGLYRVVHDWKGLYEKTMKFTQGIRS